MKNSLTFMDKVRLVSFILGTDQYTNGKKVREFEAAWSKWLGCKYSLYVSSGSTANLLLVAAVKELFNVPNGARVLLPANTWVTNVSPIIQLGLEPVFADISLEHFSFDVTRLVPDKTIKIVFVTHLLGLDAPVEALKDLYPDALFIEDICESHGVTGPDGVRRGSCSSTGSTFSFYYGHHMTTIEGGMVSTNNKELYELMRLKRSHGLAREASPEYFKEAREKYPDINSKFLFLTDGFNFRNTELGAVLGLTQLPKLDSFIEIRKNNYKVFCENLKDLDQYFHLPNADPSNSSFVFPFICKTKEVYEKLKIYFDKNGIEYRPVVAGNLLQQPFLAKWRRTVWTPNADIVHNFGLYIGNNQFVKQEEVRDLFRNMKEVLK
jgi:CDP-6-deoxy-D-xylo-4-hexulose-3-dehydrase